MAPIVGLLLAAGRSRRFGADKLLHPLPGGEPIVVASARSLRAATDRALVLIRPQQPALRTVLQGLDIDLAEVADADAGMGVTLASGVRAAEAAAGWVVALADMPRVHPDTLRHVATALREGASLAAPFHGGRRGHPVGFARRWYAALSALDGDEGARRLLQAHGDAITRIDVNDPGCLFDVDTPDDLRGLMPAFRDDGR
ncbi:molybdenum cofactor cytidylyltransferase [Plasticicumulans lactativorans]|uniref:Molybdenum cofactor cytidylyltransferase n=1 Tax=Plasticicumulans lactativorans TaxID=1133106 RepID=A0A4R2L218_9GAMM|nr:nucleotidyltransferase family protein [Plasticicumulans lactativorans]TCO80504.1 molybdenum cofactor cytidylyltransferase [Plasticicumulans lactativorans]